MCHAAVDERRAAREARVGPDAEALGDAGAEPFDERVGTLDEPQHDFPAGRMLQVDADGVAAAGVDVPQGRSRAAGADPGQLQDPETGERTGGRFVGLVHAAL